MPIPGVYETTDFSVNPEIDTEFATTQDYNHRRAAASSCDQNTESPMSLDNIRKIDLFEGLDDSVLAEIDSLIQWKEYPKAFSVLSHHEKSTEVYFVAKGSVRATTYSFSGKEIAYQDLGEGTMFGEISFIDELDRTTNVVALEKCTLGKLTAEDFWRVIDQQPTVVRKLLVRLSGLVRFLCGRVYEYGAMGVNDRIRAEILRHAKENMVDDNRAVINNMPTHEDIANRVTTHREAVTKEFSHLNKEGYIKKDGRSIIVPDVERLADLIAEYI